MNQFEKIPKTLDNTPEEIKKQEQSPEEIKAILEKAMEKKKHSEVILWVFDYDEKNLIENIIIPEMFDRDVEGNARWIYVAAEDGTEFPIELSRIGKVELPPEEK